MFSKGHFILMSVWESWKKMWTEVDLILLPALQKTLGTVNFRKQSILICSKGAAKKSLPMSAHVGGLLAVFTQACHG